MFEQYKLEIYGALAVAAILAIIVYGAYCHHAGYDEAETKYQLEIKEANDKAQADFIAIEAKYREKEQQQSESFNALAATYDQKLKESDDEKNVAIEHDLTNGLYASVTACESVAAGLPKAGADSSRVTATYRARLSEKTDSDLRQLEADADKCAESYNAARDLLESERK